MRIDEKLQDVQEERVLQIDAGNQKIDEEVEEVIEIPRMKMPQKPHTKTCRRKKKQS